MEASELPIDDTQVFHVYPPENTGEERIFDREIEREFVYNVGKSAVNKLWTFSIFVYTM
jgi:hypothetical protein